MTLLRDLLLNRQGLAKSKQLGARASSRRVRRCVWNSLNSHSTQQFRRRCRATKPSISNFRFRVPFWPTYALRLQPAYKLQRYIATLQVQTTNNRTHILYSCIVLFDIQPYGIGKVYKLSKPCPMPEAGLSDWMRTLHERREARAEGLVARQHQRVVASSVAHRSSPLLCRAIRGDPSHGAERRDQGVKGRHRAVARGHA